MNLSEINRQVKKIRIDRAAINHRRILRDAEAALEKRRGPEAVPIQPNVLSIFIKSRIVKSCIAAAIIAAVVFCIMYLGSLFNGTGVLWAEVIRNIEKANSAILREKRIFTCNGSEISFLNSDAVRYYCSKFGAREDMYNTEGLLLNQVYWLTQENARIKIVPPMRQYERSELTETERMVWGQPHFRAIIELLKSAQPTQLGRKRINGRETECFQILYSEIAAFIPLKVDSGVARFWIDVETSLPVRYEAELLTSDKLVTYATDGKPVQITVTGYQLQWNVELKPSIFEPNIPVDYTRVENGPGIVQPLFEPNIPALYRDALDRFIDERGHDIEGEQILVDMTYLQTQGEAEDWWDFLEKLDIEFMAAPATDRVYYTILGPEKIKAIFEFLKSSDVLKLLARPMVIGPNGYTASVALDGFGMDVKVEKRNDKVDLSCSGSEGKETFEIPSVRIRLDEAVLIKFADNALPEGQNGTSGRIFILVQMTVEGMDL